MKSELVMLAESTLDMLQSIFESDAAAAAFAEGGVLSNTGGSGGQRWQVEADAKVRRGFMLGGHMLEFVVWVFLSVCCWFSLRLVDGEWGFKRLSGGDGIVSAGVVDQW